MPRLRPETKARLLDTAQKLILAQGFSGTSVGDICEKAELTKGSFFHCFKNKDELGEVLLRRFAQDMGAAFQTAQFVRKKDPLQRLLGYINFTIKHSGNPLFRNGCLLGSFAQEMADSHPKFRSICAEEFENWESSLRGMIEAARAAYPPKVPVNSRSLAEHCVAVLEGALILSKAKNDPGQVESSLLHLKRYIKTIFKK